MNRSRSIPLVRRVSVLTALLAILAATLLPGIHGLQIGATSESACHESSCCHDQPDQPDPPPSHDHRSCDTCHLIDLAPASADLKPTGAQAWWVHDQAGQSCIADARTVPSLPARPAVARGPPAAAAI